MFILSLLPTQEFNNLAVDLGRLCTEPFVSPDLCSFPDPQVYAPAGHISCFPSKEVVLLLRSLFQLDCSTIPCLGSSCPGPGAEAQGLTTPLAGRPQTPAKTAQVLAPRLGWVISGAKPRPPVGPFGCLTTPKSRPQAAANPLGSWFWQGPVPTRKTPEKNEQSLSTYCVLPYL